MMKFPTEWKNKSHVPNHQSVIVNRKLNYFYGPFSIDFVSLPEGTIWVKMKQKTNKKTTKTEATEIPSGKLT
jgi:hypothetical protein